MKIAVDLRSLSSRNITGVENYTLNVLEHLLPLDKSNSYSLFYNAFVNPPLAEFHFVNSKTFRSRWPNRLLNVGLKLKLVKMEKLLGDFDVLFMPNLSQFNISSRTRLALTVHDLSPIITPEFYNLKRRLWHSFLNYRGAFERANVLFAVSEHTKLDLMRVFNLSEKKIKVIYPGIDGKAFNPHISEEKQRHVRNFYNLPGDFFLFLNTIEPRKNLRLLIKAFEELKEPVNLVVAGRAGWKCRETFRAIASSKKSHKIKYIGYVAENDKPALIKLSRALVYPSFYEGFGFQPLEAFACGTPVIVSSITSLPEVAGDACLAINPYNAEELSEALRQIYHNDKLRGELISLGLERTKKFSWEQTARQIFAELNNLANA